MNTTYEIMNSLRVGELLVGFQYAAFLPSGASFPPHFLKIVVEVKASGPPHDIKQWLGVSKGMLPVEYFRSNKASLSQLNFMDIIRLSQS